MSKKNTTKSGGLTSIGGGRGGNGGPTNETPTTQNSPTGGKVLDFNSIRAQRNQDNRRSVERFFLQHMVDVFCELEGNQQIPLELVEVSENGCSFRVSQEKSKTLPRDSAGQPLPLHARFYFSRDSYLRVGLNVVNTTSEIAAAGTPAVRVGCQIDSSFASSEAYAQFVRFIETFAKHCSRDVKHVSAF